MPKRGKLKSTRNRTGRCSRIMARKDKRRRNHSPTLFINGKEIVKPQWRDYQWDANQRKMVFTGRIAEESNQCNKLGVKC